jgi:hypothetical protein
MNERKVPENRAYTVTLILLVGLAAFSTAMRDLNRLKEMVSSVQELTGQMRGTDLAMLNVESISTDESCTNGDSSLIKSDVESGSNDTETERIDVGAIAEAEIGGRIELVAIKRPQPNLLQLRNKHAAQHLKEELSAKRSESRLPARIQYRTSDRIVTLDLPMTIISEIKADELDSEVTPDFPLSLPFKIVRKQPSGRTDNGRREFIFKKFERANYSSRRAS